MWVGCAGGLRWLGWGRGGGDWGRLEEFGEKIRDALVEPVSRRPWPASVDEAHVSARVGYFDGHESGDVARAGDEVGGDQWVVAGAEKEGGHAYMPEQLVGACFRVVVIGVFEAVHRRADAVVKFVERFEFAKFFEGEREADVDLFHFPFQIVAQASEQMPLIDARESGFDAFGDGAEVEGRGYADGGDDGERFAASSAIAEPFEADVGTDGVSDDADGGLWFSISQFVDEVVEVTGHAAVIAVWQSVWRAASAVVQEDAAPAAQLALAEEASGVGRFHIALKAWEYHDEGSAFAGPVQPDKVAVGKVQVFRLDVKSDFTCEDGPEGLAVASGKPPTGTERAMFHSFTIQFDNTKVGDCEGGLSEASVALAAHRSPSSTHRTVSFSILFDLACGEWNGVNVRIYISFYQAKGWFRRQRWLGGGRAQLGLQRG